MTKIIALLGLLSVLTSIEGRSLDASSAFVTEPSTYKASASTTAPKQYVRPEIYEMRVHANVSNRYAKVLVTSKVRNIDSNSQEAVFSIVTPDQAFISGFVMEIDGKQYAAHVKEKEEAKQSYEQAVSHGQAAALVAASARDSHRFTVSVNLEPESKAVFYLTYEELLERRDETYELILNIHPGQLVDLKVQVNISEARPLKFVKVPSLRTGNEADKNGHSADPHAKIENISITSAIVTFSPDRITQKSLAKELGREGKQGIYGQFVVQYDVERDLRGGEVLIAGGYFVHFFAPEDLPSLKKQVIFVLDTSGSMDGSRISQLKQSMNSILDELKPEDTFTIIEFNSDVYLWNIPLVEETDQGYSHSYEEKNNEKLVPPPPFAATTENINKSKKVINNLSAGGGTDIYGALEEALAVTANNPDKEGRLPMIIFLTDGEANGRIYNPDTITSMITTQNTMKVPIYTLSFGDGAQKDFLRKLSLKNQGFSRHIYEAADSFLQLRDFFKQISSPLLSNVTFKYVDKMTSVTRTHFPVLYRGGELATAGIIEGSELNLAEVEGSGAVGSIKFKPTVIQSTDSLERLWAYLTVKQYLEESKVNDNSSYTQKALELSLKYSFVTDVTSLLVVKPNGSTAVDIEEAKEVFTYQYTPVAQGFPLQVVYEPAVVPSNPSNPCVPSPCGPNSECRKLNVDNLAVASCSCVPGFIGSPPSCRPECVRNSECPYNLTCINKTCSDPCPGTCGQNTECRVLNHSPVCTCLIGYTGDPFEVCSLIPDVPSDPLEKLSWLKGQNNITINSQVWSLGIQLKSVRGQPCQNSLQNKTGTCSLIFECSSMLNELVDLNALKKYFCEVASGIAGVCCPEPTISSNLST